MWSSIQSCLCSRDHLDHLEQKGTLDLLERGSQGLKWVSSLIFGHDWQTWPLKSSLHSVSRVSSLYVLMLLSKGNKQSCFDTCQVCLSFREIEDLLVRRAVVGLLVSESKVTRWAETNLYPNSTKSSFIFLGSPPFSIVHNWIFNHWASSSSSFLYLCRVIMGHRGLKVKLVFLGLDFKEKRCRVDYWYSPWKQTLSKLLNPCRNVLIFFPTSLCGVN